MTQPVKGRDPSRQSLRQLYHQSLTQEMPKAIRELLDRLK
jgi:hypothetical protein